MSHPRSILLWVAALALCVGCAGQRPIARYKASTNTTDYRSRLITVAQRLSEQGYGNSSSITMQALARCPGQNCTPDVVRLMFSTAGNTGVIFEDRTIRLSADGKSYTWRDQIPLRRRGVREQTTSGQIAGVRLRLSGLERIVNATSVTGRVGGRAIEIDDHGREKLRRFLDAMRSPAPDSVS
ncbi:MAG: hypothetical protein V5A22_01840 [Salinivenus sp.]